MTDKRKKRTRVGVPWTGLLAALLLLWPTENRANHGHFVRICNQGAQDIYVAALVVPHAQLFPPRTWIAGWYVAKPNKCTTPVAVGYVSTTTIALARPISQGGLGYLSVTIDKKKSSPRVRHVPYICVPADSDKFDDEGSKARILREYTPPCNPGYTKMPTAVSVYQEGYVRNTFSIPDAHRMHATPLDPAVRATATRPRASRPTEKASPPPAGPKRERPSSGVPRPDFLKP